MEATTADRALALLERLINSALQSMDEATAFAEAELPSVIEQLLTWKLLESVAYNLLGVALLLACCLPLLLVHRAARRARVIDESNDNMRNTPCYQRNFWWDRDGDSTENNVGFHLLSVLPIVLGVIFCAMAINLTWLQIWVAPKVYLLEYAADLVK